VKLIIHLHVLPTLRISGVITLIPSMTSCVDKENFTLPNLVHRNKTLFDMLT
jgi:hypothetical protein